MIMKSELGKLLYQKCQLDFRKQEWQLRKQELQDRLPEAKYVKREADVALTEYECGGLGVWLDKLCGKWEEKRETLTRNAAAAGDCLQNLQRELDLTVAALEEIMAQERKLGFSGNVAEAARQLMPEEQELVLRNAARVCVAGLLPLLNKAQNALEEALEWARPNNRIDAAPGYTKGILLAKAEKCARECADKLKEIVSCGIVIEIHAYFNNPSGYIHGVASQFAELDRINTALGAIRQTEKQISQLQLQLTEEEAT